MRQAESAAMLIAVTRMLLNLRGRDFAAWLRSIADDFDATDPEAEHPDDLAGELLRRARGSDEQDDELGAPGPDASAEQPSPEPFAGPPGRSRPH